MFGVLLATTKRLCGFSKKQVLDDQWWKIKREFPALDGDDAVCQYVSVIQTIMVEEPTSLVCGFRSLYSELSSKWVLSSFDMIL